MDKQDMLDALLKADRGVVMYGSYVKYDGDRYAV